MTMRTAKRPAEGDFHSYQGPYVAAVPDGDIVDSLRAQHEALGALLAGVPDRRRGHRYAPGKWTIEELMGHVVDIERAFSYRAMCFVRGLADVEQPGVDQDLMVPVSGANERGLDSIAREFDHLRQANIELFDALGDEQLAIRGHASGIECTVLTVLFMIHGHADHHARVLQERYL